jgi:hypothetical protein
MVLPCREVTRGIWMAVQIERRLRDWQRENLATQRIAAVTGVGLLRAGI